MKHNLVKIDVLHAHFPTLNTMTIHLHCVLHFSGKSPQNPSFSCIKPSLIKSQKNSVLEFAKLYLSNYCLATCMTFSDRIC